MRIAAGLPRPPALRLERPQLKDMACEAPQYPWRTPHLCMFFSINPVARPPAVLGCALLPTVNLQ